MARIIALCVPCIIAAGCGRKVQVLLFAKAHFNAGDTLAIGFYNVENFFDLVDNGTEYPEYRPGAMGWNKRTWQKKVSNIASVIAAMRLDLVGLCEVENRTRSTVYARN